ncbi:hypothetical protein FDP41_008364 [Naegleria fowleri]|uniref:Uncharacterized protein n=1 Tax=Naegleria fowleri TaxID=5763 RepID=A0A6A5B5Q4_NAEFO|nr:uncharacterized protein FDP41_008364 [Naegleria fowleri]KAF0973157.1 hypothetical protein FDP41_008364 [Naegleria fowleri]CAG4719761.1 unnamed protein product [Naegleria fowleri]
MPQRQQTMNDFQHILKEMIVACANNNPDAFLSSYKQLLTIQQQQQLYCTSSTCPSVVNHSPDHSPPLATSTNSSSDCSNSSLIEGEDSSTTLSKESLKKINPKANKKKKNKVPKRYTQLRKQLRDCDHFSDYYFVFNSETTAIPKKLKINNSSIKRSNKVIEEYSPIEEESSQSNSSSNESRKRKQRKVSSDSYLPALTEVSSTTIAPLDTTQEVVPNVSTTVCNDTNATCQPEIFEDQFQELVSSWMTVQQFMNSSQPDQQVSVSDFSELPSDVNDLDTSLFVADFQDMPQSNTFCSFNLFPEDFL